MSAVTCIIHHIDAWYTTVCTCCVIRCVRIESSVWLPGFCSVPTLSVYKVYVNAAILYRGPRTLTHHIPIPSCQCHYHEGLKGKAAVRHRIPIMTVSAYNDSTTHCQEGLFGLPSVPFVICVNPQKELINNSYNQHNTAHPCLGQLLVYVCLPKATLRMWDLLRIVAKHSNPEYTHHHTHNWWYIYSLSSE